MISTVVGVWGSRWVKVLSRCQSTEDGELVGIHEVLTHNEPPVRPPDSVDTIAQRRSHRRHLKFAKAPGVSIDGLRYHLLKAHWMLFHCLRMKKKHSPYENLLAGLFSDQLGRMENWRLQ